jgi:hypothetical protein
MHGLLAILRQGTQQLQAATSKKIKKLPAFPLGCTHAIKRLPPVAFIRSQPIPYL